MAVLSLLSLSRVLSLKEEEDCEDVYKTLERYICHCYNLKLL